MAWHGACTLQIYTLYLVHCRHVCIRKYVFFEIVRDFPWFFHNNCGKRLYAVFLAARTRAFFTQKTMEKNRRKLCGFSARSHVYKENLIILLHTSSTHFVVKRKNFAVKRKT